MDVEQARTRNRDPASQDKRTLLKTEDLTIRFGGHTAVDHVSLSIKEQELKALIGPNGAGKTTFFNLLSGQLKPDGGTDSPTRGSD